MKITLRSTWVLKRLKTPAAPQSRLCSGGQDLNLLGSTLARMDTSTVVQAAEAAEHGYAQLLTACYYSYSRIKCKGTGDG